MLWEEIINNSKIRNLTTKQTFQEETQKTILTYLSHKEAFNQIVFQGGTSLRFFYGNPRFSEDLDFVLKNKKEKINLLEKISKIQTFITNIYLFIEEIEITQQKKDKNIQRITLKTISDIPEQNLQIHLELAYIPSYYNQPKILDYPPFNPAVRVEEISEILADKIIALGLREYIKGRDLWDIYFITSQKKQNVPWKLVFQKTQDYKYTTSEFKEKLLTNNEKIKKNGVSILINEMQRFLPKTILDQYEQEFNNIVNHVIKIVEQVKKVKKNEG